MTVGITKPVTCDEVQNGCGGNKACSCSRMTNIKAVVVVFLGDYVGRSCKKSYLELNS